MSYDQAFSEFTKRLFKGTAALKWPKSDEELRILRTVTCSFHDPYNTIWRNASQIKAEGGAKTRDSLTAMRQYQQSANIEPSSKYFQTSVQMACNNRCIFQTELGYLGLGPKAMNPESMRPRSGEGERGLPGNLDSGSESYEIWILLGCKTPFVLQPNGGSYLLLGECYVHGLMDGEALRRVDDGSLTIQGVEIY
jgi:hypothetical protein